MHPDAIQPGDLFAPQDRPTLFVVPSHAVADGPLMVLDSGFLFDARQALGPRFPLDAGLAVRTKNRNAVYGFQVLESPTFESCGVALFQTRYSWWEEPARHLIQVSLEGLRDWMKANPSFRVRLGCPGIPYIPKREIADMIAGVVKTTKNLSIVSRAVPPSDAEFTAACTAGGSAKQFLTRKEGCHA